MAEMSASDVALMTRDNDMWGGGGAFFWIFALLILAGGGGFGFGNNNRDVATHADIANQGIQNQLQQISLSSANNNYETAQLINGQTRDLMNLFYSNQINIVQGYNALQQQIAQLGYQMDQCCCSIKTQMLQDRLDSANAALTAAQNSISNANQSQYILSQLGRFVAWTPSGTQASTGA